MKKSLGLMIIAIALSAVGSTACTVNNASSPGNGKPGSCANIAGTYTISGSCGPDTCIVTQTDCNTNFSCSGGAGSYAGSVSGSSATFSGHDAEGVTGTCNVTVSGTSFSGSCVPNGSPNCTVEGTQTSGGGSTGGPVDAGSTGGGTSGADTCTPSHPCVCAAGATCEFTCSPDEDCNATCNANSTCSLACADGDCNLQCAAGANCTQNCSDGACTGNGTSSQDFTQNCGDADCNLTCNSVQSCKQNPGVANHTCSGCN